MIKNTMIAVAIALAGMGYAAPVMAQDALPVLKLCTGLKGGNYEFVGLTTQKQLRGIIDVQLVPTKGGEENLKFIANGTCDAGVAQSDTIWGEGTIDANSIGTLYTEYVHLLCNKESGIESFSDLKKGNTVFAGLKGSGGDSTIRGLIKADKEYGGNDYEGVAIINEDNKTALVDLTEGNRAQCMIYVGSPGNTLMESAEKRAATLELVPVQDKDFNDVTFKDKSGSESSVWNPSTLDANSYGKIMPDGAMWGNSDLETIGVLAKFLVSGSWKSANIEAYGELGDAVLGVGDIVRAEKKLK